MALNISIAAEPIFHFGEFAITNSLFTTFFVSISFIILALVVGSKKLVDVPKGSSLQNILELISEGFLNFFSSVAGKKIATTLFPFLTTLFFFIMFSNWSGLLPGVGSIGLWEHHNGESKLVPFFRAPTADLNTTFALAIIAMIYVQVQGFKALKLSYLKKFFNFSNPMFTFAGILEFIGEFTKVISFTFRLFGNIFAGEVLLAVMSFLIPILAPLPFLGLEVFVGVIQALVFVMLVLVFTASATAKHH